MESSAVSQDASDDEARSASCRRIETAQSRMLISRPPRQMVFADILVTMTSALDCDVLVAGGGPAGLAVAIAARMNGLSAIVIERHPSPPDKACGECLMPPAVQRSTGWVCWI